MCLVPVSAHGTNPASAQVAGLKVVYVPTSADGSVSIEDFRKKVRERERERGRVGGWVSERVGEFVGGWVSEGLGERE